MSRLPAQVLASTVLGLSLSLAGLGACTPSRAQRDPAAPATSTSTVTGSRAHELVSQGALLLDVRTKEEYREGHLVGAQHLSLQALQSGGRPAIPLNQPIVVYCHSGRRSAQAARVLRAAGFQRVQELGAMENGVEAFGTSPAKGHPAD